MPCTQDGIKPGTPVELPQDTATTDEQHLRALEEIRAQVGDMFQRDAGFCSRSPHKILLLDWPLHNQPADHPDRSRKVAISFGEAWLNEFVRSGPKRRIELLAEVRAAISARMQDYHDGRERPVEEENSEDLFQISLR